VIRFGAWSTVLGLGLVYGLVMAVLLWRSARNGVANRLLAALLLVLDLQLVPYVLGFAGFYDVWPQLSFAPFELGLALGPLLYFHVARLTRDALPSGWWRWLLPAGAQLVYRLVVFPLPLGMKDAWNDRVHRDYLDPLETVLTLTLLTLGLALALREHRAYQAWLEDHLSNREEYRLTWLRNLLVAIGLLLAVQVPYEVASWLFGLDYFQRFPLYVVLTAIVFVLGTEAWRHADVRWPVVTPALAPAPLEAAAVTRDWKLEGQRWLARLAAEQWWRDPDLTLASLSRQLATNTAYLSRALNEGLGQSFNEVVNRLRVDEVKARLADPAESRDLLELGLDAGFSSKSSFNRVFKAMTGMTPSRFRESARPNR
jgi:AraC-like DNA-binding protein